MPIDQFVREAGPPLLTLNPGISQSPTALLLRTNAALFLPLLAADFTAGEDQLHPIDDRRNNALKPLLFAVRPFAPQAAIPTDYFDKQLASPFMESLRIAASV